MPGIVPHRHCIVCGKAIEPQHQVCSEECESVLNKERKRQRNFMILMFGLLIALLVIMWLPYFK